MWEIPERDAAWMLMVPVAGYFLLASRMSPYLVDRYIMPLFPLAALLLALCYCVTWARSFRRYADGQNGQRGICLMLDHGGAGAAACGYDGEYLYQGYARQEHWRRNMSFFPCICVYAGVGYYENLPEFMHYTSTLLVTAEELKERKDMASVEALDRVIVLIKAGVDKEATVSVLREKYGLEPEEVLLSEGVHGDKIYLFVKTSENVKRESLK